MSTIVDLIYALLILSVPFMFGLFVGRGLLKEGPTKEHLAGAELNAMVQGVLGTKSFIGRGWSATKTGIITTKDGTELALEIRVSDPKLDKAA